MGVRWYSVGGGLMTFIRGGGGGTEGVLTEAIAGEGIGNRDVCYISTGALGTIAGRAYLADADFAYKSTYVAVLGISQASTLQGNTVTLRTLGVQSGLDQSTWYSASVSAGDILYVSSSPAGGLTEVRPARAAAVGVAISSTEILIQPTGVGAGGDITRANLLVDTGSNQWGTWSIQTSTFMRGSGGGAHAHSDTSSIIATGTTGVNGGSKFVQRCAAGNHQTIGSGYNGALFRANVGLQFTHEMDCIPFDPESNPCLATLARFMWGLWTASGTGLVGVDDPVGLSGVGVQFRVGTDTNFQFVAGSGSGTLTRVDSGVAPADGTRYIFRAKYNGLVASAGSCVLEILDEDKVVLATTTVTANGPALNVPINPHIYWKSDASGATIRSLSIIHQEWAMGLPT